MSDFKHCIVCGDDVGCLCCDTCGPRCNVERLAVEMAGDAMRQTRAGATTQSVVFSCPYCGPICMFPGYSGRDWVEGVCWEHLETHP